jgi:hypothetical protein
MHNRTMVSRITLSITADQNGIQGDDTTFSKMTLSIMTFCVMSLSMTTLSRMSLIIIS